jgi:predicted dehydrogenase
MGQVAVVQIGCGGIGMRRLDALRSDPRVDVVGLADPRAEALTEARAKLRGQAPTSERYEQLLDRVSAAAVVISTPHAVHCPATLFSLRRGLHVLCEKPLGTSAAETAACIAAARDHGVHLAVAANHLRFPSVVELLARVRAGSLGEVRDVDLEVGHGRFRELPAWLRDATAAGGGVLRDCGAHALLLLRSVLAPFDDVVVRRECALTYEDDGPAVESVARCEIHTAAGRTARIMATWVGGNGYRFRARVRGSSGTLVLDGPMQLRDGSGRDVMPHGTPDDPKASWLADTRAFIDQVAKGNVVTGRDDLERMLWCAELTDSLYAAARRS